MPPANFVFTNKVLNPITNLTVLHRSRLLIRSAYSALDSINNKVRFTMATGGNLGNINYFFWKAITVSFFSTF